ncbi:MAG: SLBB domain-containing protein [Elusimicrobia bacterium]|nr:SLBB domain-containing protein [Elusimicrobiota bacterium]
MRKKRFILFVLIIFITGFLWKNRNFFLKRFKKKSHPLRIEKVEKISSYISGEVKRPGIYYLKKGSTLQDLIYKAGGITKDADTEKISLNRILKDRDVVKIPEKSFLKKIGIGKAPEKTYMIEPIKIVEE